MLRLGNFKLQIPVFQAALSGYSDRAMRVLAYEFGAPLTFGGLLLAKSVINPKMWRKTGLKLTDAEGPVAGQLLGSDPEIMAQAASVLEDRGFVMVDLNFACPAPKVLRRGRGGALLNQPRRILAIYQAVRRAVSCPVLMKLRIGLNGSPCDRDYFLDICTDVAAEGIDALVVHGRTVSQKYHGRADWQIIAEIKERFGETTVIGSGDLLSAETAVERLAASAADGVAIARGAIGNPWIFRDLRALLGGEPKPPEPDVAEQAEVILRHFEMILSDYDQRKAIGHFRKFCVGYCRRHPSGKQAKLDFMAAQSARQVQTAVRQWYG